MAGLTALGPKAVIPLKLATKRKLPHRLGIKKSSNAQRVSILTFAPQISQICSVKNSVIPSLLMDHLIRDRRLDLIDVVTASIVISRTFAIAATVAVTSEGSLGRSSIRVKGPSVSVSIRSMGKHETRERPRSVRVISALMGLPHFVWLIDR